jgi:hypothetical protein
MDQEKAVKYTFCREMAGIAREFNDIQSMNEWYTRAWLVLCDKNDNVDAFAQFFPIRTTQGNDSNG